VSDNPFDALGLDPLASPDQITERLRELIEEASEPERARLRAAWEDLTRHPTRRVELALATFVDLEPLTVSAPGPRAALAGVSEREGARLLAAPVSDLFASLTRLGLAPSEPTGYVSLALDPILKDHRS
jgi:hypothetical protein